jgi:uncharacterized protein YbcI
VTREQLNAIANRLSALDRENRGRGPTLLRVHVNAELLTVTSYGDFSKMERTLVAGGHAAMVVTQRRAYARVVQPARVQILEDELRREVVACMTATNVDPEIGVDTFVLATLESAGRAPSTTRR